MFGFLKRNKPPSDTNSVEFKRYMAEKLDGRHVRYVAERVDNTDRIIGREGFLHAGKDEFCVICGEKTLFRAKIDELSAWELLSLEGAVLTGFDFESGKERTIIAYYKYYR